MPAHAPPPACPLRASAGPQAELEACTFNPNMADPSTSMLLPPAEGGRALPEPSPDPVDDLDNPLHLRRAVSLSRFVARQQAGRILADQRRAVPHASGETWSRAPTRTEEFALATSPGADAEREQLRASIAALKRVRARRARSGARTRCAAPAARAAGAPLTSPPRPRAAAPPRSRWPRCAWRRRRSPPWWCSRRCASPSPSAPCPRESGGCACRPARAAGCAGEHRRTRWSV